MSFLKHKDRDKYALELANSVFQPKEQKFTPGDFALALLFLILAGISISMC